VSFVPPPRALAPNNTAPDLVDGRLFWIVVALAWALGKSNPVALG
jgi:hypothetical protein